MAESKKAIKVANVQWERTPSRVLGGGGKPEVTGFSAIDAQCDNCGAHWRAQKGRELEHGNFITTIGHFTIKCPHCGNEDEKPNPPLP